MEVMKERSGESEASQGRIATESKGQTCFTNDGKVNFKTSKRLIQISDTGPLAITGKTCIVLDQYLGTLTLDLITTLIEIFSKAE